MSRLPHPVPRTILLVVLLLTLASAGFFPAARAEILHREASSTLTAVEMNHGDALRYTLKNGQVRTLELQGTSVEIVLTNLEEMKKGFPGGGTIYRFQADMLIDGQPMTMVRFVPVQQSFYEPYEIDGMRIWFDGVRKIGRFFNENHGACVPKKDARFAITDATLSICEEEELRPWYPNAENFIDVHQSYNGDDVWMGTYFGADLHGGLDVNMPIGTPLWAPIGFDENFYFNSLAQGHNNNRWRGIREWKNGQQWTLQSHHITRLLVPQHTPVPQNTHYAVAAGVLTGSHAHSHFVFKVNEAFDDGEQGEEILLDPWILFWQIFENNRKRGSAIEAKIAPLSPAKTGQAVSFSAKSSRPGPTGNGLSYYWTFGDGGFARGESPSHIFIAPGIYPVTLVVDDGTRKDRTTHHLTVSGHPVEQPALVLASNDSASFQRRSVEAMDVYGSSIRFLPHTVHFTARPARSPKPPAKRILLENIGRGTLSKANCRVEYLEGYGWAEAELQGEGNQQWIDVTANARKLRARAGCYHARVVVTCPGAINPVQEFQIELTTPPHAPSTEVVVDQNDPGCRRTPWFWVAPRFHGRWPKGYRETFLVAGGLHAEDAFVRFTPDLAEGRYDVAFTETTPFRPTEQCPESVRFRVRVKHRAGEETIWMEPLESRHIGTFDFSEGTDGYVQIETKNARGLVVADAVRFRRIAPAGEIGRRNDE